MWKGRRTERRLRHRTAIRVYLRFLVDLKTEAAGQLHEQLVRMLTVDDREAEGGFAGLKKQRVPSLSHRRRLQTEHRTKPDPIPADLPRQHGHEPVCRKEFVPASGPCLL